MKKQLLIVLSMVVLLLAGCIQPSAPAAGGDAAPATTTLTYFTFSAAPDHLKDLDAMIAAFNKVHPEITIKVETAPYNDYFPKLQTMVAGGTAPDVYELNYENFVSYASKGVLLDLSESIKGDSSFDPAVYYPRAYEAIQ